MLKAKTEIDNLKKISFFHFDEIDETNPVEKGIATINGLKLGKMEKSTTSWSEINMAFGQCLLLLYQISKYHNFTLPSKLVPKGSFSQIESRETGERYNFFFTSDRETTFAKASELFVKCCNKMYRYLLSQNKIQVFKYDINEEKSSFDDCSVIYKKPDMKWCAGLKKMLKILLLMYKTINLELIKDIF